MSIHEDRVEISNVSTSYFVSKDLIFTKIPYLGSLFKSGNCQFLRFEFNKNIFEALINWIYSDFIIITMDNFLPLYDIADRVKLDSMKTACEQFFDQNFTIETIPVILKHIGDGTEPVSFKILNSFLARNYLRILNSVPFLDYPFEVVRYILSLDLEVDDEYQVFQGIKKWIEHDKLRLCHLPDLLKCIRFCHTFTSCYSKIKEDDLLKNFHNFDTIACSPNECKNVCLLGRIKEKSLISLYRFDENRIGLSILKDTLWEPCGIFKRDDELPISLLTPEHVIDLIFSSGRSGVRIDLEQGKFRWLEMSGSANAYFSQILKCIKPAFHKPSNYKAFIQDNVKEVPNDVWIEIHKNNLVEYEGQLNVFCYTKNCSNLYAFLPVEHPNWYSLPFQPLRVHAIILNNVAYIICEKLEFRQFDLKTKNLKITKPEEFSNEKLKNLELNFFKESPIVLVKSRKELFIFNVITQKWSLMGQINFPANVEAVFSANIPVQLMKKMYLKKETSNSFNSNIPISLYQ